MKWISVKDSLPNKESFVLVLSKEWNCAIELYFDKKGRFIRIGDCCSSDDVVDTVEFWIEINLIPLPDGWSFKEDE